MTIISFRETLTDEEMVDLAENLSIFRRMLSKEKPWGSDSRRTEDMAAAYRIERLLRFKAGEEDV